MNKKFLFMAILGGLSMAQAASAQEYDDRWYVSGSTGINVQDNDRNTKDSPFVTLGLGKFITPRFSLEGELNYQKPEFNGQPDVSWAQYGASLDGRYHFRNADSTWWPYLRGGLGWQRHEEEAMVGPTKLVRKDSDLAVNLGTGLQFDFGRTNLRTEIGTRLNVDEAASFGRDNAFVDVIGSIGVTIALGGDRAKAPMPSPPPPVVAPPSCADMDDDNDGVNNCNDNCPTSQAGQAVGMDGCPVPITIDLAGVNFDFDKATLRPESIDTLNQAVGILTQYQELRVEVAGHTDLCGGEGHNQTLSEKRAIAVYEYLISNGVDPNRFIGPTGYGESRPLENTPQSYPACRSEVNRRTELNIQN